MFKVNNRNTRTRCEICSKLTIKTLKRRQWRRFDVFFVNFEHILHLVLVLSRQMPAGLIHYCITYIVQLLIFNLWSTFSWTLKWIREFSNHKNLTLNSDIYLKKLPTHLNSDSHLPKIFFICFNESPLKMLKNAFCFILKALFVLKIFNFLSWHFGHVEKTA